MASFHDDWMEAHAEVAALPAGSARTELRERLRFIREQLAEYEETPTPFMRGLIGEGIRTVRQAATKEGHA